MKYLKYFEQDMLYDNKHLKTLEDLNMTVLFDGDINLSYNQLTSLKYCSETVSGYFIFVCNNLISLEFCPKHVGSNFNCAENKLTSLEFCPKYVGGNFNCSDNKITSLEFCPEIIKYDFICDKNNLTSLEFCPKYIAGDFHCEHNLLTSLDFLPNHIGGWLCCRYNNWTNPIPYEIIKKYNFDITNLYTIIQYEKFGAYEYQKEFLTNTPEKYKDLEIIGYNEQIKEEFDWLFNASDMGLM